MKLALAQMHMAQELSQNVTASVKQIQAAAAQKADLILFPEIQLSPFFPQYRAQDAGRWLVE